MNKRTTFRLFSLLVVSLIMVTSGCGYRFADVATSVRGTHFIEVNFFENRTLKANLEPVIADEVSGELALRGWHVGKGGDHLLRGSIVSYETPPASYSRKDRIMEYRAKMTVDATLTERQTGRTLWARRFLLQREYPFDPSYTRQENNEEAAVAQMARELGREIHLALLTELQESQ